jgi:guanylate kinase
LVGRDTEDDAAVQRRLKTALAEIAHMDLFQYVVVNADIERAVDELDGILRGEGCRLPRLEWGAFRSELLNESRVDW